MEVTLEQFQTAVGATEERAQLFYSALLECIKRFTIDDAAKLAAFCGTISVESDRLNCLEEDLYYKRPERLLELFPSRVHSLEQAQGLVRNPKALSLALYSGYHGRGLIQLTWERNYKIHGDRLGFDYVGQPTKLLEPWHAVMSAGSYWDLHCCNDIASNMDEVTLRVNGPKRLALAKRIAQRDAALEAFA